MLRKCIPAKHPLNLTKEPSIRRVCKVCNQRDFDLPLARDELLQISGREDPAKSPAENKNLSRFCETCAHFSMPFDSSAPMLAPCQSRRAGQSAEFTHKSWLLLT